MHSWMLTKQEELKQKQTKNFLFSFNILHYKVVVWTDLVLLLICNEISQEVRIKARVAQNFKHLRQHRQKNDYTVCIYESSILGQLFGNLST